MRHKEQQAAEAAIFANTRSDIHFVRAGRTGQWRDRLAPVELQVLTEGVAAAAAEVGYALDTPVAE
jgi:hypothetical protein